MAPENIFRLSGFYSVSLFTVVLIVDIIDEIRFGSTISLYDNFESLFFKMLVTVCVSSVAPTHSGFVNYRAGSSLEVKENTTLNVTCETANAKPEAVLSWFANGKRIDAAKKWTAENSNKTFTSRSSLVFHVRYEESDIF